MQSIKNRLKKIMANSAITSGDELYIYMVMIIAIAFTSFTHLCLLVIMIIKNVPMLLLAGCVCLLIHALCLYLVMAKRAYAPAGILLSLAVIAYTLLTIFGAKINSFSILYLFIILPVQLLAPYAKRSVRTAISALIWLSLMAYVFIFTSQGMRVEIAPGDYLSIFNINLTFVAFIVEIAAVSFLRDTLDESNDIRMAEFENQANTDQLTQLYNRRGAKKFFDGIGKRRADEHWCVAMLDIDNFKIVNDTLGHSAGDVVLKNLAEIIRFSLRKTDSVFRWGGEEFLILLEGVSLEQAYTVLNKLRLTIEKTEIRSGNNVIRITVTIGVAALNPLYAYKSIEESDMRLYKGKQNGKNQVVTED